MAAKILLVEDSDTQLKFLRDGLVANGFEVETATNGGEGYKKIFEYVPDIVVSDIMMPVMDGLDMVKNIKENREICHIPIILLSAKSSLDDRISGLEQGIDDYITKPFNILEIKARMKAIMRRTGGTEKEKSILGIPVTLKNSLTTFAQAEDILTDLTADGVSPEDIRVQYYNWTNAGITGKVDLKAKPAGCLGGKGDWEDLMDYAGRNGITIYPAVDNQTFASGSGYYTFTDTTVRISGSYARIYPYNLAYGNQSSAEKPLSLLSPAAFSEIYEKLTGNFTKKNLSAVSLGSMTSALYGDYGKKEICRDKAQEILTRSYQQITDADIAMLADTANAYALPYVQELTDVPLQSSGYDVFDEDIPFYQMVMHGLKPYASPAVNASATPEETVLLSIATGSSLHYDMIGGETSELKDTVLDGLYYAGADDWKDNAAQSYAFAKTVTAGLGDQQITGYVREGDVITTTYENGAVTEVDLAAQTVTADGKTYALSEYVEEGSWK